MEPPKKRGQTEDDDVATRSIYELRSSRRQLLWQPDVDLQPPALHIYLQLHKNSYSLPRVRGQRDRHLQCLRILKVSIRRTAADRTLESCLLPLEAMSSINFELENIITVLPMLLERCVALQTLKNANFESIRLYVLRAVHT